MKKTIETQYFLASFVAGYIWRTVRRLQQWVSQFIYR